MSKTASTEVKLTSRLEDMNEVVRRVSRGVHNPIVSINLLNKSFPSTGDTKKHALALIDSAGGKILVFLKSYNPDARMMRGHVTSRFPSLEDKAKYEYEMHRNFYSLGAAVPIPMDLRKLKFRRDAGKVREEIGLMMQYSGAPSCEEVFLAIRQELTKNPKKEIAAILNEYRDMLVLETVKSHMELYTLAHRARKFGNKKVKEEVIASLRNNIFEPARDMNVGASFNTEDDFDEKAADYYVDTEFKDHFRHILLFRKALEGVRYADLRLMAADSRVNQELESSLEELCDSYRPIFIKDVCKNSPMAVLHGDENFMNASYTYFTTRPSIYESGQFDQSGKFEQKVVIYDFASVFFGPIYLGLANLFADPVAGLNDARIKSLLRRAWIEADDVEDKSREELPEAGDKYRLFGTSEESINKALRGEFAARINAKIRFAGVSFEYQLYSTKDYNNFINAPRPYKEPYKEYSLIEVPGSNHDYISNDFYKTLRYIPRVLRSLCSDLEGIIKDHKISQEEKSRYERLYSAIVKSVGERILGKRN